MSRELRACQKTVSRIAAGPCSSTSVSSAAQKVDSSSAGTSGSNSTSAPASTSANEETSRAQPSPFVMSSGPQSGCAAVHHQRCGAICSISTGTTYRCAMALLELPEPFDFALTTERFLAFGDDLANFCV